jgi:murein DD-endopeptidase MepM/ murein hydrolase activator NlpD
MVYRVGFALLIGIIVYLIPRFEWHAPVIRIHLASNAVGLRPFNIEVTEEGRGLAQIVVTLSAGGVDRSLRVEHYSMGTVKEKQFTIALAPEKVGVKDGPAVLQVTARDRSYWRFFQGNETTVQKNITVDTTPPTLELLSDDRYVNVGGSGMVIYKASSDTEKSGVRIANYFFPAYKIKEPERYAVFFAHPYDVPDNEKAVVVAEDGAGNARQVGLSYTLKGVRYRKSTLSVDDQFIQSKVAPLLDSRSAGGEADPKTVFLKVNRDLRKQNEMKIKEICQQSSAQVLWKDAFHQLSNSKVEANFADQRTYVYKGDKIDQAYHLGFDLAVTKNSPVEAANDGLVVFVGDLGIYGNTIILDHGWGIFTLYSHLSSIGVKLGDKIQRKQIMGNTGETGLAAGDHLHYSVLIHGVPVLPLEWWDPKWIKDNVQSKLVDLHQRNLS